MIRHKLNSVRNTWVKEVWMNKVRKPALSVLEFLSVQNMSYGLKSGIRCFSTDKIEVSLKQVQRLMERNILKIKMSNICANKENHVKNKYWVGYKSD